MDNKDQSNFYTDKSISSKSIDDLYNELVPQIDEHRSYFDATISGILTNFSIDAVDKAISNSQISTANYNESRCHSFYRIIGLPIVDQDGNISNPGFNKYANNDSDILDSNIQVCKNLSKDSLDMSFLREKYFKDYQKIFQNQDNISTAYVLSSIFIRPFNNLSNNVEPLDKDDQKYSIEDRGFEKNNYFNFSLLKDSDGNNIVLKKEYRHILKPFIVDPRIDYTVLPANKKICVPFTLKKEDTKLDQQTYLIKPLLELICQARFNINNKSDEIGEYRDSLINYLKSNNNITDTDKTLISNITSDINKFYRTEIYALNKFLPIMKAIAYKLKNSLQTIYKYIFKINYNPLPNVKGPEFGCTLKEIVVNDERNTDLEKEIILHRLYLELSKLDLDTTKTSNLERGFNSIFGLIGGTGYKNIKTTYESNLNKLTKNRDTIGDYLNNAVRDLEIIMGEFSGLGLIDIVAILTALWTIDQKYLVNMLDEYTFNRMYKNVELRNPVVEARKSGSIINGIKVLKEFENKVKQYLDLQEFLYNFASINIEKNI